MGATMAKALVLIRNRLDRFGVLLSGLCALADDAPSRARQMLFGNWEMNWLAYNYAHDLTLPGGKGKVGFFMYPCGETAEGKLDSLDPATFRYTIGSREIVLA